jgi:hypothetical protein
MFPESTAERTRLRGSNNKVGLAYTRRIIRADENKNKRYPNVYVDI